MLGKNIFNIALSCSLIWHLLGVQVVGILWPVDLVKPNFATINFWGPILESPSLNSGWLDVESAAESRKNRKLPSKADKVTTELTQVVSFNELEKETLPLSELSEKATPEVFLDIPTQDKFLVKETIEGQLKRSVLIKPELPEYPKWAKELDTDFEIKLKFLILPDGTVGVVEKITSSGYPELDELGMRYIRRWKFLSLPAEAVQEEQWVIIKLFFKLQ